MENAVEQFLQDGRLPTSDQERFIFELGRYAWTRRGLRHASALHAQIEAAPPGEERDRQAGIVTRIALAAARYANSGDVSAFPIPPGDSVTRYIVALLMSQGGALSQQDVSFLFPVDAQGKLDIHSTPGTDISGFQAPRLNNLAAPIDWGLVKSPPDARIEAEAKALALAFANQMVQEALSANRPPLIGDFVMSPPDYLPLIAELHLEQIRLIIQSGGIWCSLVFPDSSISPGWWSPKGDNLIIVFGERAAWMMRVFLSCLWRDATVVKKQAFRVKRLRSKERRGEKSARQAIVLPRTIRTMEWGDDETQSYYSGESKAAHGVRAHYRRLAKATWQASPDAIENAERAGLPAPPDGFTFVQAYAVGGDGAPRVVAKGLSAAAVALSKLR